jgi:hypothetical protein
MNVREIVIAHLKAGGFDGLCCDGCGCGLDDLMPCDEYSHIGECKPAKAVKCDQKCGNGDCEADGVGTCYRPAETPTNEEETHL